MLQQKLDVLNKAGLSKDNFHNSDAKNAKEGTFNTPKRKSPNSSAAAAENNEDFEDEENLAKTRTACNSQERKITDFFSASFTAQDLDDWCEDDSFEMFEEEGATVTDSDLLAACDQHEGLSNKRPKIL